MTPILVVAGFVGSGKTTLLRQLHEQAQGRRILFLVNEWGATNVDGHTLRADGARVIELPGGSLVCRCLAPAFLDQLRRTADESTRERWDGLVIEASGLADPRPLPALLREARLDSQYGIHAVVTLVDSRRIVRLAQTLPVLAAQVEAADVMLLNKCDLCDEATILEADAWVQCRQPRARVVRCVRAALPFDVWTVTTAVRPSAAAAPTQRDPSFELLPLSVPTDTDPQHLAEAFQSLPSEWLRIKGWIAHQGRMWRVDWDGASAAVEPVLGLPVSSPQRIAVVQRSVLDRASADWAKVLQGRSR
jgi:G3E family GTPase